MAHSNDLDFFDRIPVAGLLVNKIGRPNFICNLKFLSLVGYNDSQMSEAFIKDYTKVFDEAERYGKTRVYLTVNKHNDHAIEVYKKTGFVIVDEAVTDIGSGYVMDDYIFEYEL